MNPGNPQISVLVPIYNVEPYLPHCLESLLAQSLHQIEIICIDDGSTDESWRMAESYVARDARVRTVQHKENRGLSAARNTGLALARASYIMFCDADDWYEPEMCEKMLAAMQSAEGVDYAACETQLHYEEAPAQQAHADEKYYRLKRRGLVQVDDNLLLSTDVSVWNKIFRRELIEARGIRFPEGLLYEDNAFFHAYALCSQRAVYLQAERLYHYRRRRGSIMSATLAGRSTRAADLLHIAEGLHAFMQQQGMLPERLHYYGKLFFSLLSSALEFSKHVQNPLSILDAAAAALARAGVDFSAYPDLAYQQELLRRRIPMGSSSVSWGGLLKIKYKARGAKRYFMGIPLGTSRTLPA